MTDYAPNYELGENIDGGFNGGSLCVPVKYTTVITKGNPMKIIGTNQDQDNTNVALSTASTDLTRYIAIHSGAIDESKEALLQGRTKAELGGTVSAGDKLMILADSTFTLQTGTNPTAGFALQSGVDGDFIQIYFSGVRI